MKKKNYKAHKFQKKLLILKINYISRWWGFDKKWYESLDICVTDLSQQSRNTDMSAMLWLLFQLYGELDIIVIMADS